MLKHLGFAAAGGMLLIGQGVDAVPGVNPVLGPWLQFGASGLLGFLLYWIVVRAQPKERQETRQHTERLMGRVCEQFERTQQRQHEDNQRINEAIRELARNCVEHLQQRAPHTERMRNTGREATRERSG